MATITFNRAGFQTITRNGDRLAGKSFLHSFREWLLGTREPSTGWYDSPLQGERWCDATERELNNQEIQKMHSSLHL